MSQDPPGSAPTPNPSHAAGPARRFSDAAEAAATVIASGIHIKGEVAGSGAVDVAGILDGDCRITGLCRVRAGARLSGEVTASSVIVDGEVTGRLVVAERVEIGAAGRVRANIRARVVAIAEGAYFEGDVNMDATAGPAVPTSFKEKRRHRE
jgi:cytoskeletal protein CcmA (bactofilin family)